ncbi:hypothetical protein FA15DRAFT_557064, partial [Coprinopsis marcescibilis]
LKNLNLRYECLDEQDDYHSILKQRKKDLQHSKMNGFGFTFDQYEGNNSNDDFNELLNDITSRLDEIDDSEFECLLGKKTMKHRKDMLKAFKIIDSVSW